MITASNVANSINGIGSVLHSTAINPEIQIKIFKMLEDAGGDVTKIEKEKRCLLEIYLLFSTPVEMHTIKMYITNCNIR